MSPSEFQLRSALRDGEGEFVSADTVIARARGMQQARHDRRVRTLSVAAIVAVVGGIGIIGGIAMRGGHDRTASGGGKVSATVRDGAAAGAKNPANRPTAAGPQAYAVAVACPVTVPRLNPPVGGGSDQSAAAGSLFSGPVESIKICVYQQEGGAPVLGADGRPASTVLTGEQATTLAASLDAAPQRRPSTACPLYATAAGKTLVIIGLTANGQAMKPITATVAQNPCGQLVTNGSAIRYGWSAPASLGTFLAHLRPAGPAGTGGGITIGPSDRISGSPIQS